EGRPDVAAVQGVIVNRHTGLPERSQGVEIRPAHLLGRALGGRRLLRCGVVRSLMRRSATLADHVERVPRGPVEVESLAATAVLIRRSAFEEVGGFDPSFFLYGEDLDLCHRARTAGYEVWFVATPPIVHLGGATRTAAGMLLSVEAGALTGYLAQRVLGQYEFALVDPDATARLLFVAPNIGLAARRLDADPEQLLTWIAFHEVTHAVQFAGVPWLRPYLAGLLRELLASLDVKVDPRAVLKLPSLDDAKGLLEAVRKEGLVGALASGGRRELLDRVQGVMGVVEGHAEHVMDVVGAAALPSLDELRRALDLRRRERSPLLALLERLIGLDAKLRQYEDGKRFCDAVATTAGAAALHRVFDGPEQLPTVAELQDPAAWMRRTGAPAAA
ncbi:MAG: zinc-dependent metalloprotease, partial [Actinobacteria bacterium]|nr:zinc-dependent metalloprotease [Actinomycetota bacterium]